MDREKLAENLIAIFPILHKKLFKNMPELKISKQQIALLFHINYENGRPMRYYGEKLTISKPNLTPLVDKLIKDGLIERKENPDDRREIILSITKEGKDTLDEHKELMKKIVLEKLAFLDKDDLSELDNSLNTIINIFHKLES